MKKQSIPSPEEFARASKLMEESFRNLDEVRQSVLDRFGARCRLHEVVILEQTNGFRAYLFFERNDDMKACRAKGTDREIVDHVYSELERFGRGTRDEMQVVFELDSDENVEATFGGDYNLRLR